MKKAFLAALMLALTLCACADKSEESSSGTTESQVSTENGKYSKAVGIIEQHSDDCRVVNVSEGDDYVLVTLEDSEDKWKLSNYLKAEGELSEDIYFTEPMDSIKAEKPSDGSVVTDTSEIQSLLEKYKNDLKLVNIKEKDGKVKAELSDRSYIGIVKQYLKDCGVDLSLVEVYLTPEREPA